MSMEINNLTPEQRRTIYLEEKSRIEGVSIELTQEQVKKVYEAEKTRLDGSKTSTTTAASGDASGAGGVFAFLVVVAIIVAIIFNAGGFKINSDANEAQETPAGAVQTSEAHGFTDYSDELTELSALN